MSVIFLNHDAVHYETLGRGRPVVFLHTWAGTWRYWVPAMQLVSGSHAAYALDLLGFGDTARDSADYSVERQANVVRGFLDEMGIDRIALVGHGLGALVGLRFAGEHTSRLARMLVIGLPVDPAPIHERLNATSPAELIPRLLTGSAASDELLQSAASIDARVLETEWDAAQVLADLTTLRDAQVPCLLLYGAEDGLLAAPAADLIRAVQPAFHQIVLDASGHFPMLDAPESFNRLLLDFLALESGASLRQLKPKDEWRRRLR